MTPLHSEGTNRRSDPGRADEGWPDDPDNPALMDFAQELRTHRPALSDAALSRVRRATSDAIAHARRRHNRTRWNFGVLSAAALILLAVFVHLLNATAPRDLAAVHIPAKEPIPVLTAEEKNALLADFAAANDLPRKLTLLPRMARAFGDNELPENVRYLLALELTRAHLTWHPVAPPSSDLERRKYKVAHASKIDALDDDRWEDGHTGEPWMIGMLDAAELERIRQERERARAGQKVPADATDKENLLYWRLSDPAHADVSHAVKLLDSVANSSDKNLAQRARKWANELRRNNTVVTFDLPGGYVPGENGPLVMDVRNAEKVTFKLYRARSAKELLAAAARIGEDFIYRDYGLREGAKELETAGFSSQALEDRVKRLLPPRRRIDPPALAEADLIEKWDVTVSDLKSTDNIACEQGFWDDDEWDQDEDAAYFDDMCERFRDRLRKVYCDSGPSAWQYNKVAWIPKKR